MEGEVRAEKALPVGSWMSEVELELELVGASRMERERALVKRRGRRRIWECILRGRLEKKLFAFIELGIEMVVKSC